MLFWQNLYMTKPALGLTKLALNPVANLLDSVELFLLKKKTLAFPTACLHFQLSSFCCHTSFEVRSL